MAESGTRGGGGGPGRGSPFAAALGAMFAEGTAEGYDHRRPRRGQFQPGIRAGPPLAKRAGLAGGGGRRERGSAFPSLFAFFIVLFVLLFLFSRSLSSCTDNTVLGTSGVFS